MNVKDLLLRFLDDEGKVHQHQLWSIIDYGVPLNRDNSEMNFLGAFIGGEFVANVANENSISLEKAFKILEECQGISMEDGAIFYPRLSELKDKENHIFAIFEYKEDGCNYFAAFEEGVNSTVKINKNVMTLIDSDGDEITFYLLGPMDTSFVN